ncbi:ABC transporter substrate-binding protein [Pigmentibacter ruber]|uniref:ABC transporter substrate-binding protein n=1 Tax=Pigmentibacter ruber TaxID=2683196 RepID=UPI00131B41CE|nr:ABC transporter substrate-binding protein [Pigmentibacter ruber]
MLKFIIALILHLIFTFQVLAKNDLNLIIYDCNCVPFENNSPNNAKETVLTQILGTLLDIKDKTIYPKILKNAYFDYTNQEYVLEMKENIYFHNNRIATLDDLEFSLLRHHYATGGQIRKGFLGTVVGINKIAELNLKKYVRGIVVGIKQEIPNKLRIKLENPDPDFLYKFTNWRFSLVPMEELKDNLLDWKKYPVGVGPYKVLEPGFQNGHMRLLKYDQTLTEAADVLNIYTEVKKGVEYDISVIDIHPGFQSFYTKDPVLQLGLTFVNANELGNNLNFRKFIQAAINSKELEKLSKVYKSVNEDIFDLNHVNTTWGTRRFKLEYNPSLAKIYFNKIPKHLREKEWLGTVYSGSNEIIGDKVYFLEEIKKQLASYGFKIKYVIFNDQYLPKELAEKTAFDVGYYKVEPYNYLYRFARLLQSAQDKYPRPLYDAKLEELYDNALNAKSRDEKFILVNKLNNYVHEKAYWFPLVECGRGIYYNPNTIKAISKNENDLLFLKVDEVVMK